MSVACACTTHKTIPVIKRKTSFTLNRVQQFDPTHTLVLRAAFAREMKRRFNLLKRDIRISIVDNDCFGLRTRLRALAPADKFQFAFGRSQDKIRGFMGWLEEQEKEFIFSSGRSGIGMFRRPGIGGVVAGEEIWSDLYIQSAYQQGITRGRAELRKAGYDVPMFEGIREEQAVAAAFNQPFHADRVGLLYTRTFSELKGITSAMDQQISRVLAQGMAEGRGPTEVARRLSKVVDGIGRRRAEVMARTEFIRAHHVATINEYRQAGVAGVKVLAEWLTAGDARVCAACGDMEDESSASPFTLDEIEGMIPLHALCRCCAIPAKIGVAEKAMEVAPPTEENTYTVGRHEIRDRMNETPPVTHFTPGSKINMRKSKEPIDQWKMPEFKGKFGTPRVHSKYIDIYHVTDKDATKRILEEGVFRAGAINQYQGFESATKGTYGWATRERALLEVERAKELGKELADELVVIRLRIPRRKYGTRLRPDENFSLDPNEWMDSYRELMSVVVKGDVPSTLIQDIYLKKGRL